MECSPHITAAHACARTSFQFSFLFFTFSIHSDIDVRFLFCFVFFFFFLLLFFFFRVLSLLTEPQHSCISQVKILPLLESSSFWLIGMASPCQHMGTSSFQSILWQPTNTVKEKHTMTCYKRFHD